MYAHVRAHTHSFIEGHRGWHVVLRIWELDTMYPGRLSAKLEHMLSWRTKLSVLDKIYWFKGRLPIYCNKNMCGQGQVLQESSTRLRGCITFECRDFLMTLFFISRKTRQKGRELLLLLALNHHWLFIPAGGSEGAQRSPFTQADALAEWAEAAGSCSRGLSCGCSWSQEQAPQLTKLVLTTLDLGMSEIF